jgi:hypothetical protein
MDGVRRAVRDGANLVSTLAEAWDESSIKGLGIGQLATSLIYDGVSTGRLVHVLTRHAMKGEPVPIVCPVRTLLPHVRAFVEMWAAAGSQCHLGSDLAHHEARRQHKGASCRCRSGPVPPQATGSNPPMKTMRRSAIGAILRNHVLDLRANLIVCRCVSYTIKAASATFHIRRQVKGLSTL